MQTGQQLAAADHIAFAHLYRFQPARIFAATSTLSPSSRPLA
jgi:hypothetical protein